MCVTKECTARRFRRARYKGDSGSNVAFRWLGRVAAEGNCRSKGGTGQPSGQPDTRLNYNGHDASHLPNGLFQLTSATLPYDQSAQPRFKNARDKPPKRPPLGSSGFPCSQPSAQLGSIGGVHSEPNLRMRGSSTRMTRMEPHRHHTPRPHQHRESTNPPDRVAT